MFSFLYQNTFVVFQNPEFYEEQGELENIIKQAAKERLQLEKQLTQKKVGEKSHGL